MGKNKLWMIQNVKKSMKRVYDRNRAQIYPRKKMRITSLVNIIYRKRQLYGFEMSRLLSLYFNFSQILHRA